MNRYTLFLILLLSADFSTSMPQDPCHPNPCGRNTQCFVSSGRPVCSCLSGYHGNPLTNCQKGECQGIGKNLPPPLAGK